MRPQRTGTSLDTAASCSSSSSSGSGRAGRTLGVQRRGVSWRMALPSACHSAGEGMGERHVGSETEVVNLLNRSPLPDHPALPSARRQDRSMRVSAKVDYAAPRGPRAGCCGRGADEGRADRPGAGHPAQVPGEHPPGAAPRRARAREPARGDDTAGSRGRRGDQARGRDPCGRGPLGERARSRPRPSPIRGRPPASRTSGS